MTDPSRTPPDNPFFAGLARAVLAYRWPLLALTLAIAGFFGNEVVQRFKIDSSTEAFLSPEAESRVILDQVREDFGADFFFQVVVEGDVFSIDFLKRLQALHLDLQALNLDLADLHPDDTAEAATEGINETATGQQEDADPWADDEGWGDETGG